jgi:hypothetical protein
MQEPCFGKPLAEVGQIHAAEAFIGRKRQFERRALQMVHQNFKIVRLNMSVLGRAAEEVIRDAAR